MAKQTLTFKQAVESTPDVASKHSVKKITVVVTYFLFKFTNVSYLAGS